MDDFPLQIYAATKLLKLVNSRQRLVLIERIKHSVQLQNQGEACSLQKHADEQNAALPMHSDTSAAVSSAPLQLVCQQCLSHLHSTHDCHHASQAAQPSITTTDEGAVKGLAKAPVCGPESARKHDPPVEPETMTGQLLSK